MSVDDAAGAVRVAAGAFAEEQAEEKQDDRGDADGFVFRVHGNSPCRGERWMIGEGPRRGHLPAVPALSRWQDS